MNSYKKIIFMLTLFIVLNKVLANESTTLKISFLQHEAIIELENNPTTKSLLSQLPAEITFNNYGSNEKVAQFPIPLNATSTVKGYQPKKGDITSYGPWGNLAIFIKDSDYFNDLIYLGKFISGFETFINQDTPFKAKIDIIQ